VAAPIAWEELDKVKSGATYSIRDADKLIERADRSCSRLGRGQAEAPKA
jgi:DNA primase